MRTLLGLALVVTLVAFAWLLPRTATTPEVVPTRVAAFATSGQTDLAQIEDAATREPPPSLAADGAEHDSKEVVRQAQEAVVLEVVDENERPLVGVELCAMTQYGLDVGACWCGTTGPDGRAVFDDFDETSRYEHDDYVVAPASALATPREVRFHRNALPRGVVRFQLEPTCSIEVVALDASGAPVSAQLELRLRIDPKATEQLPASLDASWRDRTTTSGSATFAFTGLDLPLEVSCFSHAYQFETRVVRSPIRAGERLLVELGVNHAWPRIEGRAVSAEGLPLARANLELQGLRSVSSNQTTGSMHESLCDGEGRFRVHVHRPVEQGSAFRLTCRGRGEAPARATAVATSVTRDVRDHDRLVVDLGDVQLARSPVVVSGRVLDSAKRPVAGARIEIRSVDPGASEHWGTSDGESGEDGIFSIGAELPWNRIEVRARLGGLGSRGEAVAVDRGARDVVLMIARPGSIATRMLVHEGIDLGDLDLLVTQLRAADVLRASSHQTDDDGRVRVNDLAPGSWTIEVQLRGEVLATRRDVVVHGGETTTLAPIDLRSTMHAIAIHAVDEHGTPLERASATLVHADGDGTTSVAGADRRIVCASTSAHARLVVTADDRRSVLVPDAVDGTRVVLPLGIECEIVGLEPLRALPEGVRAQVRLRLVGDDALARLGGGVSFNVDAHAVTRFRAPLPGRYAVSLTADHARKIAHELATPGATITVVDDDTFQSFVVAIDPRRLDALLRDER